jgi:FkbM family methyltransferase
MIRKILRSFLVNKYFSSKSTVVYDFGAHNGDNIPYYLLRFDSVVAVEANPDLAMQIRIRFEKEILEGRVVVENCVVSKIHGEVDFYIHKSNTVLSQLCPPEEELHEYLPVKLTSRRPSSLVRKYGPPHYVKVDIELSDFEVLEDLFNANIFPSYISAEVHDIRVFSLLTSSRQYQDFKLLDGQSVEQVYQNCRIGKDLYSFPFHSAGPYYEDIKSTALTAENLFKELSLVGLGWKDIHAKKILSDENDRGCAFF